MGRGIGRWFLGRDLQAEGASHDESLREEWLIQMDILAAGGEAVMGRERLRRLALEDAAIHALVYALATGETVTLVASTEEEAERLYDRARELVKRLQSEQDPMHDVP